MENVKEGAETAEEVVLFNLSKIKDFLKQNSLHEAETYVTERIRLIDLIAEVVQESGVRELTSAEINILNETLVKFHPFEKTEVMTILNFLRK